MSTMIHRMTFLSLLLCSIGTGQTMEHHFIHPAESGQQDSKTLTTRRNPILDPAIFGTSIVVGGVAIHYGRYTPLWKEYKAPFFVKENFTYALNQDKMLHFYGACFGSTVFANGYEITGMQTAAAEMYGIAASALLLTFVEMEDGRISYLGFDRTDFAANLAGAIYPLARRYVPVLKSFSPKMSFHSSGKNVTVSGQKLSGVLSDHEGQTFWIGITIHDLLPEQLRSSWPSILGIALGRSVEGLDTNHPSDSFLLALDLDLRKLPGSAPWTQRMWGLLNFIHLPMPAVRFSNGAVWYGLYF